MNNPMMNGAPMGAPGAPAPAGGAPGVTVCIASQPDGTFMVYPEGQGADAGQACQDVDQALEAAETMLTGSSDAGNDSAAAKEADDLFTQGFKQARGRPLNRSDEGDHEYR